MVSRHRCKCSRWGIRSTDKLSAKIKENLKIRD